MTQSNSGSLTAEACQHKPKIILFDLLTALIDSWEVWNDTAGSKPLGKSGA